MMEDHSPSHFTFLLDKNERLETVIEKLADISSELKSLIAVHEQRITQQEKDSDDLHDIVEKRREEMDSKIKTVYETMDKKDKCILEELAKIRQENVDQHRELAGKIVKLEKYIWMAIGGGISITWVVSTVSHLIFH